MFATPKLLEALAQELENRGTSVKGMGITGIFAGGTEFTPQYTRFAMEELLGEGVYMTPTYGNTLMGLAGSKPVTAEEGYKITYYAPQPRAVIERSEEHTSELQSRLHLVCRLLLEKKKQHNK